MNRPLPAPQCLEPGCRNPAAQSFAGAYLRTCAGCTKPAPTLRELIAAGPRFEEEDLGLCPVCGLDEFLDVASGICRPCWRVWRWSPVREREIKDGGQ